MTMLWPRLLGAMLVLFLASTASFAALITVSFELKGVIGFNSLGLATLLASLLNHTRR